jgi:hypothetical protein
VTTPAILQTWLWYAEMDVPIVPEHSPDPASATGCDCRKADCKKPAKHPRTAKGSLAATTDPDTLERWAGMWSGANTGTDAGLANVVVIAPDCLEWDAEFQRRGLDGAAIAQTGGGEGHKQYWFRRSPGCPQTRICRPGEYDILSNGNVVIPPSLHASGNRYTWLQSPISIVDLPEEPAWARADLLKAGRSTEASADPDDDPDGPPVRYHSERKLRRWRGELVERKKDGTLDRSDSLFFIGLDLAEENASRRTIIATLEERDGALGWNTYTGRPDRAKRYGEIAVRAIAYAEQKRAEAGSETLIPTEPAPPLTPDQERLIAELRAMLADERAERKRLQAELTEARDLLHAFKQILSNPEAPLPTKAVALASEWVLESKRSRGKEAKVYGAEVAEMLGISPDTANRHLQRAYDRPDSAYQRVAVREVFREGIDRETGERLRIRASQPTPATMVVEREYPLKTYEYHPRFDSRRERLWALAQLTRPEGIAQHGGERPSCKDCGDVGTYRQIRCNGCHRVLDGPDPQFPQDAESTQPHPTTPHGVNGFYTGARCGNSGADHAREETHDAVTGTNGSANGHHPPLSPTEPLRATPLQIIEMLQSKYGPEAVHNDAGEVGSL